MRLNPAGQDYLASPSPNTVRTVLTAPSSSPSSPCPSCPPSGRSAHFLTLLLSTVSIFLAAWTILGSIAAPGGTVFALLALIVLALLGGEAVRLLGSGLSRILRINVCLPPLLGMLVVGIALKNIPYNFGQFGRAECTSDHRNASFVDSIHDLDQLEEHRSFKRSVSQLPEDLNGSVVSGDSDCSPRYIGRVEHSHKDTVIAGRWAGTERSLYC